MMINIEKSVTCSVTGHRIMQGDIEEISVEKVFLKLIDGGYKFFLIGMALGFDSMCFRILEKIRKEKEIKIIACIPCDTQAEKFCYKDKKEYERMLKSADEKIHVSKEYTPYCMMKRNMFLVDNSSVLVSYKRRDKGGTAKTVAYAEKNGCMVIEI